MVFVDLWPITGINNHLKIGDLLNVCLQKMLNAGTSRREQAIRISIDFIGNNLVFGAILSHIIYHLLSNSMSKWM